MFLPDFRETGVSQEAGVFRFETGDHNSSMLTNTFATPREGVFLTGVIYDDAGADGYSVGDGRGNFEISAGVSPRPAGMRGATRSRSRAIRRSM